MDLKARAAEPNRSATVIFFNSTESEVKRMKLQATKALSGWKAVFAAILGVPTLGLLTGCEEAVRETLMTGFNTAANGVAVTLINAAFQTMADGAAAG